MEERKKEIDGLIRDLNSGEQRRIVAALKKIPELGSPEMVEPMFALYTQGIDSETEQLLEKILHNLKDPNCIELMVGILQSKGHQGLHAQVMNAMWQSGLDVSEHVTILVETATIGDYMTILEAMTVIEQMEIDDERALNECIAMLDESINQNKEQADILGSLRQVLLDKLLG